MPTPDPCGPPCWPGIPPLQDPPQEVAYARYLVVIDINGNTTMLAQPTNLGVLVWDGSKFYWADGSDTYQLNLTQLPDVAGEIIDGILGKTTTGRIMNLVNRTATHMVLGCVNGVWTLSEPGAASLGGDLAPLIGSGVLAKLAGSNQTPFWLDGIGLVYVNSSGHGAQVPNGANGSILTMVGGMPAFADPTTGTVGSGSGAFGVGIPGIVAGSTGAAAVNIKVPSISLTNGTDVETVNNVNVNFSFANPLGLGGLDVGAEAASTWYYLYITTDGAGAVGVIGSLNPVSPDLTGTTHTFYGLASLFRNNGSSNIVQFLQRGRKFSIETIAILEFSLTTAFNAIPANPVLTTILPPSVMSVTGIVGGSPTSDNPHTVILASTVAGIGKQFVGSRRDTGGGNIEGFRNDVGTFHDLIIADSAAPVIYGRAEVNHNNVMLAITGYTIG